MINDNRFLGTGWSFPPEFFEGGAVLQTVSGEEDIKQSLQILLTTSLKERLMQADYGCDLKRFLFESINQGLINDIRNMISDSILNHEPRIEVNSIELENIDAAKGLIHIHIDFKIRMTNSRFNYVYPFYLNEVFD